MDPEDILSRRKKNGSFETQSRLQKAQWWFVRGPKYIHVA
jgi:hypothetical protein